MFIRFALFYLNEADTEIFVVCDEDYGWAEVELCLRSSVIAWNVLNISFRIQVLFLIE